MTESVEIQDGISFSCSEGDLLEMETSLLV